MKRIAFLAAVGTMVLASVACGDDDAGTGGSGASGGGTATGTGGSTTSTGGGGTGGTGGSGGGTTEPIALEIDFAAQVNGAAFQCGTVYDGVGMGNTSGQLTDFRLYVHDLEILTAEGAVPLELEQDGVWQLESLALLDFEDKAGACANGTTELNTSVRGEVPAGTVPVGLRFKLGVPFELNHADAATAPSPLNLTALFWNWQGGYKFLRADFMASGAMMPFNLHLGSTGCDGDPSTGGVTTCDRPNVTTITLDSFDPTSDTVVVDYGAVIATSDLGVPDAGGAPGCMSGMTDPECPAVFQNLGIDMMTGTLDPSLQTLFTSN
ncbi:MAG: metallo-mystery pair system four-Cys motif protein [Polyangiaceae bacterium]